MCQKSVQCFHNAPRVILGMCFFSLTCLLVMFMTSREHHSGYRLAILVKPLFNCVVGLCLKMESFLVLVPHRGTSVKVNTWYTKYKARCNERVVCLTSWSMLFGCSDFYMDAASAGFPCRQAFSRGYSLTGLFWGFFICISYHIGKMVFFKITFAWQLY